MANGTTSGTGAMATGGGGGGLDVDAVLERRRLRRGRALWRALAVVGVVAALAAWTGALSPGPGGGGSYWGYGGRSPVARLVVSGTITEDRGVLRALDAAARDASVRALIVAVDSPGGTVAGGEALHAALSRFRAAGKPLVAVMGGTAASAGYMIALPAERVFARDSTLTGSIGVILQSFDASDLLARLGVRPEIFASGPLKAQPNPFAPVTEEGRRHLQGVIADLHGRFVEMVAQGRGMDEARVRALADGRVMTGRQALAAGLVDAIGGEREARAHLAAAHGIPAEPEARDLDTTGSARRLPRLVTGWALAALSEWLRWPVGLDGAVSVWHPPAP